MLKRIDDSIDHEYPSYLDTADCLDLMITIKQINDSFNASWGNKPLWDGYSFQNKDDYALYKIADKFIPSAYAKLVLSKALRYTTKCFRVNNTLSDFMMLSSRLYKGKDFSCPTNGDERTLKSVTEPLPFTTLLFKLSRLLCGLPKR